MEPILVATSLGVRFDRTELFSEVDLTVMPGEIVAVVGRSGVGKTTLLSCLAGLLKPTTGRITVMGCELTSISPSKRARLRLEAMGFVYQNADLLPELNPIQNVALPALLAGWQPRQAISDSENLVRDLGVRVPPTTMAASGGEAQRLALARALVTSPSLLLADEPTGSLDSKTRDEVLTLMFSLVKARGMGAVVVTHDEVVASASDRTVQLGDGL